jgi:predicted adenine nucleotide alpha hydrolase (AANH) superfamily ATPase
MPKILLHACCAVCFAYPAQMLKEKGYKPVAYFHNPNIYPESEYFRRMNELLNYCEKEGYICITCDYDDTKWRKFIAGLESEPEKGKRCSKCFQFRLENTAKKAAEMGIENFTTTLTVSPHKVSKNIIQEGLNAAEKYGVNFVTEDFKKNNGFLKTSQQAKENNFYRQQYCGCEFSKVVR